MSEETTVGQQVLRFEEPDLLVIEFQGDISLADMARMYEMHDTRLLELGYLLTLVDVKWAGGLERAAQRVGGKRPKRLPHHAVAVVGAGFSLRVFLGLLVRSTRLLTGAEVTMTFFDDSSAARDWLREMRPILRAQSSR